MTTNEEFLHTCKLQLSHAGSTVTLDTRAFERLLSIASETRRYGHWGIWTYPVDENGKPIEPVIAAACGPET